jgi:hypothetical protein
MESPFTGYASPLYRQDRMWLCRPDLPRDACHGDLTTTELHADGSRAVEVHVAAETPDVDCFYVYPTVDLGLLPGNHTDFSDLEAITRVARAQAARFGEVCAVYVPLYRQVTIGTYVWGGRQQAERLDVAFSDVEDAFLHYMGQYNRGHRIVLIGHSQGAEMVMRLIQHVFDDDPVLRSRLVVALAIGGPLTVRHGERYGRAHNQVPVCTSPDEIGCAVGYHSYHATGAPLTGWRWGDERGEDSACVNPASVGATGWRRLSGATFPTHGSILPRGATAVTSPYVVYRDRYWAACVEDAGHAYLLIADAPAPGDTRQAPIDLDGSAWNTSYGLHALDVGLALGDLVELVREKAELARSPGRH